MEDKKGLSKRGSSCLSRSHSVPSLSQTTSPENKTFTPSQSLPDLLLKSSFEEFTPDISVHTDPADSDHQTSEVSISVPPPSSQPFSTSRKRKSKGDGRRSEKKRKKDSFTTASAFDYPAGMSGHMQDDTREREPHSTAGPSNLQLSGSDDEDSDSAEFYGKRARMDWRRGYDEDTKSVFRATSPLGGGCFPSAPFSPAQGKALLVPARKETDDGGPSFDSSSSSFGIPTGSQSTAPTVPQHPRRRKTVLVLKESTVCTEGSKAQDALEVLSVQSENDSGGDSCTLKMSTQPTHSHPQIPSSDPGWSERGSSCLSRSHSVPSLSQTTSPENKTFTPSQSLPDLLLKSSFEEFTSDITVHTDPTDSDHQTSEVSLSVPPPSSQPFSTSACCKRKFDHGHGSGSGSGSEKKHKKDSFTPASIIDEPICLLELTQDDTREMEPHSTAGPSIIQLSISDDEDSNSAEFYGKRCRMDLMSSYDEDPFCGCSSGGYLLTTPSLAQGQTSVRDSSCLSRSHSVPLLSQISSSKDKTFTRSQSLPDMLIKSSSEEFTTDSTLHSPELRCLDMSGPMQDDTREMELMFPSQGGVPYSLELSSRDFAEFYGVCEGTSRMTWDALPLFRIRHAEGYVPTTPSLAQDQALHLPDREDTDDDGPSSDNSSIDFSMYSRSMSTEGLLQCRGSVSDYKRSTVCQHSLHNLCIGGGYVPTTPSQAQGEVLDLPNRKDTDYGGSSFDNSSSAFSRPSCSQSTAPTVWGPPCPQDSPVVLQDSTLYTEETETSDTALDLSVTNNQSTHSDLQLSSSDPGWSERDSSCLSRSHGVASLGQTTSPENKTFTLSQSLSDLLLKTSFEEFIPDISVHTDPTDSDHQTSEVSLSVPPPSSQSFSTSTCRKRKLKSHSEKKHKKDSFTAASAFASRAGMSGHMQDDTREMEPHSTAGPSIIQLSSSDDKDSDSADFYGERVRISEGISRGKTLSLFRIRQARRYFPSTPSQAQDQALHLPDRKDTDDGGFIFDNTSITFPMAGSYLSGLSSAATVWGPPCPQDSPAVLQDSTVYTEGSRAQDDDVLVEMETSDTALDLSVTNSQSTHPHPQLSSSDPGWSERDSSCLSHSHSVPSLSQTTESCSFEEFTPDISVDEDDETYWFQCSCPGLYQCSVTGLVFHMEGEGDVVYRTVPWDRRLLAQHHKQSAGPLFDIKCLQQSVCRLHLPHCEIRSTGGCEFLSVAHVNDEGIEFIVPQKITETHVIINITGFSGFGNVKDEDSPPDPVRALVLLFYRPPADPDPESLLNVLLLPVNIVLRDVLRTRKKLFEDEIYIETSPHCKLSPKQEYTLSTCPEDDSVLVQPTEAEFYCDNYDNYFPSFQVILEKIMKYIKLFLRETKSSKSVWERRVCLSSTAVKRSCGPSALNLPPNDRLLDIRSSFIDGISGPVLKSLLDKLLEKTVLTDSERESADEIQNHRDKARFVVDTVRKKGEAASSEMIQFLCEVDPFLCEHLGLI